VQTIVANNRVRALREARGITQAELARRLGIGEASAAALETPTRSLRTPTLRRVAVALGCSIVDLLPE
jgi:transcriptional regulator with XRE-family HTH domain